MLGVVYMYVLAVFSMGFVSYILFFMCHVFNVFYVFRVLCSSYMGFQYFVCLVFSWYCVFYVAKEVCVVFPVS